MHRHLWHFSPSVGQLVDNTFHCVRNVFLPKSVSAISWLFCQLVFRLFSELFCLLSSLPTHSTSTQTLIMPSGVAKLPIRPMIWYIFRKLWPRAFHRLSLFDANFFDPKLYLAYASPQLCKFKNHQERRTWRHGQSILLYGRGAELHAGGYIWIHFVYTFFVCCCFF